MQLFEKITKQTSAEKEISVIFPAILSQRSCLGKRNTDVDVQMLKSQLRESLKRRLVSASFHFHLNSKILSVATFLDPRYILLFLGDPTAVDKQVVELVKRYFFLAALLLKRQRALFMHRQPPTILTG